MMGLNIMDYSLLLLIENRNGNQVDPSSVHMFNGPTEIYHVAIIDYLQAWNTNKKGERFLKTTIKGKDGSTLSVIEPSQYGKRYIEFMTQ